MCLKTATRGKSIHLPHVDAQMKMNSINSLLGELHNKTIHEVVCYLTSTLKQKRMALGQWINTT